MEYGKAIKDMAVGELVEGFYILKSAAIKNSSNGKAFFSGSLADQSGSLDMKCWDYAGPIGSADEGGVIKIQGEVTEFKGVKQLIARRMRMATDTDQYDIGSLIPTAPIQVDETIEFVKKIVESLKDDDYKSVCREMLERHIDTFAKIPAAKSVHHGFVSGLLMHTANMLEVADFLSDVYSEVINRDLLLSGTLLHDFAKEKEFALSKLGIVTDYTVKGQLLGHLVMGAQEVCEVCDKLGVPVEKSVLLQHLILSHHGEPEYGAAVRPACAESELLSYIDLIDSRMEIFAEVFQDVPVGAFSDRIFSLDKKIYHHE